MAAPDLARLRRLLLGLIGPNPLLREGLDGLDRAEWDALDAMAAQHRLQPHLHARLERGELDAPIPARLREHWGEMRRAIGLQMLAQRVELLAAASQLREAGIPSIALKGAWLAWHAYPTPGERPMRDVDLLLPPDRALEGFRLLESLGHTIEEGAETTPEAALLEDKHFPPLLAPNGTRIELHVHPWEPQHGSERFVPPEAESGFRERAISGTGSDGVAYPARHDMVAHLIIHAVYSHRLDAGPLLLADLDYTLQTGPVDWAQFWQAARDGQWERGAALVLALVDRWRLPGLLEQCGCRCDVPEDLLGNAPDLLLQDLDARKSAAAAAGLSEAFAGSGSAGMARRALQRVSAGKSRQGESPLAWFARRSRQTIGDLLRNETRHAARSSAALGQWLEPPR